LEYRPDLSRDVARVVMRALQRDPALRYQSMREMSDALAPYGPSRSASTVVEEIQKARGRLGEILVTEGMISQQDLDGALAVQRREGRLLGQVLIATGLATCLESACRGGGARAAPRRGHRRRVPRRRPPAYATSVRYAAVTSAKRISRARRSSSLAPG